MNTVNGSVALQTAHKLRSAAAALMADSANQSDPRLADSLMYEASEITKRAQALEARPDEPEEFGSIVRASCGPGLVGVLWQKAPLHNKHYWEAETGAVDVWSELTDVEVLRVGIGEPVNVHEFMTSAGFDPTPAQKDAYVSGFAEAKRSAAYQINALRRVAITAERKDAYDSALRAVEELNP